MKTIYFLRLWQVVIVVGIYFVAGCRSGAQDQSRSPRTNPPVASVATNGVVQTNCTFICFEDVGWSDFWIYPFTVCIDDPSKELKDCIGKQLGPRSAVNDFGPEYTLLKIVKLSPADFRELEVSISNFLSHAKGQVRGEEDYGTVGVTIFYESKEQSKDLAPEDYKLLLNQIPGEVLQRNPELAIGTRGMIKGLPLSRRKTQQ
jgi:hypothetical protein